MALAALLPCACGEGEPEGPRPNLVVVVLDTLRADYLGFLGHERETAPFLARLAERSAVFPRAWSSSSWTAPATASLFTGRYPDQHGVTRGFFTQLREAEEPIENEEAELVRLPARMETLPVLLAERGYATFGLATNINIGPELGFDRGFERFERHDGWPAAKVWQHLRTWREELRRAEPFLLYLHLNDVHKPYQWRKPWFQPVEGPIERGLYQSEIGYLDHWLERILADLAPLEDTLVVVVSDHGEEFLDHGDIGHHLSLYDELSRIVMLFAGPGVRPGFVDVEASIVDVVPTLLELVGAPAPEGDGISLAPLLSPESEVSKEQEERCRQALAERSLFSHRWWQGYDLYAVVRDGWKLIDTPTGHELYDLENDPREQENLAGQGSPKEAELARELERWRSRSPATEGEATRVPIGADLRQRLQDLGYVR